MLPKTTGEMIDHLITIKQLTVPCIARAIGVTGTTIHRIRQGARPSRRTDFNIMRLYLQHMHEGPL